MKCLFGHKWEITEVSGFWNSRNGTRKLLKYDVTLPSEKTCVKCGKMMRSLHYEGTEAVWFTVKQGK